MDVRICLNKCHKCETVEHEDIGIIKRCDAWKDAINKIYFNVEYTNVNNNFSELLSTVQVPSWCPFFLEHLVA